MQRCRLVACNCGDAHFDQCNVVAWLQGTKCIVFDMDGTITVGDQEVVTM